ncbi:sialate O-acetylesterase [Serratia nematodiphila]
MSNNGLPVTDVVGVSVSLGQRRTAGASSGDAYAQAAQNSAVNAAGSAAHAEQSELSSAENAENAKASEISAAESAQSAKADAEIAQSGSNAYPSAAAAQAAIDEGTETRQYFPVWGLVGGDIWTERYENVNGLATPTGDILATRISFLELINSIYNFQEQSAKSLANTAMFKGSGVYPLLADKNNNIALGYDDNKGAIVGVDVQSEAVLKAKLSGVGMSLYRGAGDIVPIIGGNNNGIALGYDTKKNELVGLFPNSVASDKNRLPFKTADVKINFLLAYGQSLSTGVFAQSVLSLTQPYNNITFSSGVRGNGGDFSGIKPLVEDSKTPTPDEQASVGETVCSGAANYASLSMYRDAGINPADHVIFSSTAGHGGYTISQLAKGSAWYNSQFMAHLRGAANLNNDIALHAIAWLQGETDSINSSYTKAAHLAALEKIQKDVSGDAQATTGQGSPVMFLTYQHSSRVKLNDAVPLALLEACQKSDYFYFVAPTYAFPHYSDGLHLMAVGYKWIGAYYGRAYKQAVIDGNKPLSIMPIGATYLGNKITVRFTVPVPPLVLDVTNLASTKDYGFAVAGKTITSVEVSGGNSVIITLDSNVTGVTQVSYAFDNLAPSLNISNGASGNLRDSCSDTCIIDGVVKPMFYLCPHFKINAISEVI